MNSTNLIIIKGLVVLWVILIIAAALIIDAQNKKKKAQELQLKLLMKKSNFCLLKTNTGFIKVSKK